jgi:uncharacterized protein YndB with AHSA1/START domain
MNTLSHPLTRTVVIRARPEIVFRFFTDSTRFASWWGAGSTIDPTLGGEVRIILPGGVEVSGKLVELRPPELVSFTYGYETGHPELIPPGGSLVTLRLEPHPEGTMLRLRHDFATVEAREAHVAGWRYQLALFANVVAREAHGGAEALVDRYFAVWSEPDSAKRLAELTELGTAELLFRDGFGATASPADLADHIGAAQVHMPGLRLERTGALRQCQGTGVADWVARAPDGTVKAKGSNVFDFAPDGRLTRVVGLWAG